MNKVLVLVLLAFLMSGCEIKTLPGVDCLLIDGHKAISVTCDWNKYKR